MRTLAQLFLYGLIASALLVTPEKTKAADKKKIIFISGKLSHGPMSHEHRAGNMILAKRLNESGLNIEAVVLPDVGYPKDSSVLKDADSIVIYCSGHGSHVLNPHLKEFDKLMQQGVGVVMIHWATEAVKGDPADKFLEWMGGFCDLDWSVNPHWTPTFKPTKHEIWNGVKPFTVNDEWYYHMRFAENTKGLTPILTDVPGPETLKRPNGPRSGNPHVRKAVANKETQHVAWAYERPTGKGRGFGFTGGHVHMNWQDDSYRKIVLNAILWTTGLNVPENGIASKTPTVEEMHSNLDPKGKKKPAPKAKRTPPARPPSFDELRAKALVPLDSQKSLNLLMTALSQTTDSPTQIALMKGILKGLEGQRNMTAPPSWYKALSSAGQSKHPEIQKLLQQLGQIFGDKSAHRKALAVVRNKNAPNEARITAFQSLVTQRSFAVKELIPSLLNDSALQVDAIRAFSTFESKQAPSLMLGMYPKLGFNAKRATIEALASRKLYATALLRALKKKQLPREDIPTYIARSLSQLLGKEFDQAYGSVQALSQDKAKLIAKYRNLLTPERLSKADVHKGRQMFDMVCASCHQIYGKGGLIGPDLTGSNRGDIDYILLNMIDPSADVPDAYKQITITTKDEQLLVGTLSAEDGQRIVLNTVGQKQTILKSDIKKRDISNMSMMPEGLLPALQNSQVADLVKYLQTKNQVSLPQ